MEQRSGQNLPFLRIASSRGTFRFQFAPNRFGRNLKVVVDKKVHRKKRNQTLAPNLVLCGLLGTPRDSFGKFTFIDHSNFKK